MGLLNRLLRTRPPDPEVAVAPTLGGTEPLEVVGESFHQDALRLIAGSRVGQSVRCGVVASLVAEPDNPYDPNAVAVHIGGHTVGHLSAADAKRYQAAVVALEQRLGSVRLSGVISGGGFRDDGPGSLGVFLYHDPADFGVTVAPHRSSIRTGFSEALLTDAGDDSYDLSWSEDLPTDRARRIPKLRALLGSEPDLIDRHYMLAMLGDDLYACRDAFSSALEEYDAICEQHHTELTEGMRAALVAKFGVVPLLDLYRQASIRHSKLGDLATALFWAERGVAVYGEEAARPEHVDDLTGRVAKLQAKLAAPASTRRPSAPRPPAAPKVETLLCQMCGVEWQRTVTTGRKPRVCPTCLAEMAGPDPDATSDG